MNQSFYDWYYNRLRPYVTHMRAVLGLHSDFRPIGKPVYCRNGRLFILPMANVSYTFPEQGRVVTFDVRNAKHEFCHHIQTRIPVSSRWAIGWYDDNTVIAKSDSAPPEAYIVGTSSLVYRQPQPFDHGLVNAIEALSLPSSKVRSTLAKQACNRTRR